MSSTPPNQNEKNQPPFAYSGGAGTLIGRDLDEFRVVREIDRGGMGIVYEAFDTKLERRVAIKVLHAGGWLNPEMVSRFRREASATAALRHPHILPLFAVGQVDDISYFAMELIEGQSLSAMIGEEEENKPHRYPTDVWDRPFYNSARVVAQVAEALDHAHRSQIYHRDVKPSNILIREDGSACLIDFGLARDLELPSMTRTDQLMGSPFYIPPERLRGKHELDERMDEYSLGVVFYELLTGSRPFKGSTAQEILHRIVHQEPMAPRKRRPSIPLELETICMKAMAKDPDARYATCAEMAADLRRFQEGAPVLARRPHFLERTQAWLRRPKPAANGVWILGLAAVILLAALFSANMFWGWGDDAEGVPLQLSSEQVGVVVRLYEGTLIEEPASYSFTLPMNEPRRVRPGNYALMATALGRVTVRRENDQALFLAPDADLRDIDLFLPGIREDRRFESLSPTGEGEEISALNAAGSKRSPLVVWGSRQIELFSAAGQHLWTCDLESSLSCFQVGDVNADGLDDIVYGLKDGRVLARSREGEVIHDHRLDGVATSIQVFDGRMVISLDAQQQLILEGGRPLTSRRGAAWVSSCVCSRSEGNLVVGLSSEGLTLVREESFENRETPWSSERLATAQIRALDVSQDGGEEVVLFHSSGALAWWHEEQGWTESFLEEPILDVVEMEGRFIALTERGMFEWRPEGWLLRRSWPLLASGIIQASVHGADFNSTLVIFGPRWIIGLRADGTEEFSFKTETRLSDLEGIDLDGGGTASLVALSEGRLSAYRLNTRHRFEKTLNEPIEVQTLPGLGSRFWLRSGDRSITLIGAEGEPEGLFTFPWKIYRWVGTSPPFEDKKLCVLASNKDGAMRGFGWDGSILVDIGWDSPVEQFAVRHRADESGPLVVATSADGELQAFMASGFPSFGMRLPGQFHSLYCGSLDGDRRSEVLGAKPSGQVVIWNDEGKIFTMWSASPGVIAAQVMDIGGDGTKEIVLGYEDDRLEVRDCLIGEVIWSGQASVWALADTLPNPVLSFVDLEGDLRVFDGREVSAPLASGLTPQAGSPIKLLVARLNQGDEVQVTWVEQDKIIVHEEGKEPWRSYLGPELRCFGRVDWDADGDAELIVSSRDGELVIIDPFSTDIGVCSVKNRRGYEGREQDVVRAREKQSDQAVRSRRK